MEGVFFRYGYGYRRNNLGRAEPRPNKAELQIACAFLPGRIADAHVSLVARHLLSAVGMLSQKIGLVTKPVATLTQELGEPCRHYLPGRGYWPHTRSLRLGQ